MAVQLKKKQLVSALKKSEAVKVGPLTFPRAVLQSLVKVLPDLRSLEQKVKMAKKAYEPVQDEVLDEVEAHGDQAEPYEFEFEGQIIKIHKPGDTTVLNPQTVGQLHKALDAVKPGLFYEVVKVNLTDLRDYLTPEQIAAYTVAGEAKKRVIKVED